MLSASSLSCSGFNFWNPLTRTLKCPESVKRVPQLESWPPTCYKRKSVNVKISEPWPPDLWEGKLFYWRRLESPTLISGPWQIHEEADIWSSKMLGWFGKLIGKLVRSWVWTYLGFPSGAVVKNLLASSPAGAIGDVGSIPWSETCPGIKNDNPLQYSCQHNPMDRGAWQATVHGVTKNQTETQLSNWACTHTYLLLDHTVHRGTMMHVLLSWCMSLPPEGGQSSLSGPVHLFCTYFHAGPQRPLLSAYSDILPNTMKSWHLHCFPHLLILKSEILDWGKYRRKRKRWALKSPCFPAGNFFDFFLPICSLTLCKLPSGTLVQRKQNLKNQGFQTSCPSLSWKPRQFRFQPPKEVERLQWHL